MFSYYGSKSTIAYLYPEPEYDLIIEPFCGAAAYSLYGKRWEKQVYLFDLDENIITAWKYLIKARRKDILQLPILKPGETLSSFKQLSSEEKCFLGYMISASPATIKTTTTDKTNWTPDKRYTIASNVRKVDHWKAEVKDFRNLPFNYCATWFIDPSYKEQGKYYRKSLKNHDYLYLAENVKNWYGQKIVCESVHAVWLPFKPFLEIGGQPMRFRGQSNNKLIEGIYTCNRDCTVSVGKLKSYEEYKEFARIK